MIISIRKKERGRRKKTVGLFEGLFRMFEVNLSFLSSKKVQEYFGRRESEEEYETLNHGTPAMVVRVKLSGLERQNSFSAVDSHCHSGVLLPWPKKSLQPRNSWGWSAVWSCDIVRHRASVRHRRDPRYLRVASSRCRSKSMSHDITWSHCGSTLWISQL